MSAMCCSTENKNLGEVGRSAAATVGRPLCCPGNVPDGTGATTPGNPSLDAESGGSVLTKRKGNGESRPAPAAVPGTRRQKMNPLHFLAAFLASSRYAWRALDELSCRRRARCQSCGMPASTRHAAPLSAFSTEERERLLAALTDADRAKMERRGG